MTFVWAALLLDDPRAGSLGRVSVVDHLVYATPDLDATVRELRAQGVPLTVGGPHPGLGTRNQLADLGDGAYLEVIGPDPEQPPARRPFGIDELTRPGLVTGPSGWTTSARTRWPCPGSAPTASPCPGGWRSRRTTPTA